MDTQRWIDLYVHLCYIDYKTCRYFRVHACTTKGAVEASATPGEVNMSERIVWFSFFLFLVIAIVLVSLSAAAWPAAAQCPVHTDGTAPDDRICCTCYTVIRGTEATPTPVQSDNCLFIQDNWICAWADYSFYASPGVDDCMSRCNALEYRGSASQEHFFSNGVRCYPYVLFSVFSKPDNSAAAR